MDVLPMYGDRVRVPVGAGIFHGFVVYANGNTPIPYVIVEMHLPDVEPYQATFLLSDIELDPEPPS